MLRKQAKEAIAYTMKAKRIPEAEQLKLARCVWLIRCVHKSNLINLDHIVKYTRGKGGQLTMADGSVIDISPNKKEELMIKFTKGR